MKDNIEETGISEKYRKMLVISTSKIAIDSLPSCFGTKPGINWTYTNVNR